MSASALLATCVLLYVGSGGRMTIALAIVTIFYITRKNSVEKPVKNDKKQSPIYAVDFTTSTTTTPTTTSKPKTIASLRARRNGNGPKVFKAAKPALAPVENGLTKATAKLLDAQVYIFYTTLTGTALRMAKTLKDKLGSVEGMKNAPKLVSLDDDVDDLEEYFLKTPGSTGAGDAGARNIYILVLPSYETDSPIDYFLEHLADTYNDFRVDKYPMRSLLGFAVLGVGDSESWPDKFCYQARAADRWLAKLGGRRMYPLGEVCIKYQGESRAVEWMDHFATLLADDEPFYLDEAIDDSDEEGEEEDDGDGDTLVDVEELAAVMKKSTVDTKQMVAKNSPTYRSLTKQGYTIVGSHSGVKICRWTKSALRGRGSCYKYAFYGIRSHLCMETTPSLACSNKCVFCWRHGTNPVAKLNWRWEVDPPETVFEGALAGHYQKIKQMRGVPGIHMDRFHEAFAVKHCALSLVGEPIFYPHINEFVGMLHKQHISSFLVCNAQHPPQLAQLKKVTQLYVSIDAPTQTDLKKIDRPLNSDFWDRLMACLDILKTTQSHQRTVFRLTLVKGFNMGHVEQYADMVIRAQPSQIEVKGATFCGLSNGNGNPLTMQNIPFLDECRQFVIALSQELQSRGHPYEVAAEHAHSCCILIAHTKFKIDDIWHTHINYPRFFELLESGRDFVDLDYVSPTPAWAVWGSAEGGFNPEDTKWDRKAEKAKRRKQREMEMEVEIV